MVICSNCGASVAEGKFCEKCGSPLVPKEGVSPSDINSATNNKPSGGGFFDKISSSMNKAATDLMAIKSDFSNGTLIYKVNKIPNVQEKKSKLIVVRLYFITMAQVLQNTTKLIQHLIMSSCAFMLGI